MHSAIEHTKTQTLVYVPGQWDTIFLMARRQNPYNVVPLTYNNFYDLKSLLKTISKILKQAQKKLKLTGLR